MIILYSFLVGGLICMIGQILMDKFKLMPVHITCSFVFFGAFLDLFNIYDKLVEFAGAGAMVPISSFGHSLLHAALDAAEKEGYIGLLSGVFELTATGISVAIVCAFFVAVIFKPRA